jgi:PKD domain
MSQRRVVGIFAIAVVFLVLASGAGALGAHSTLVSVGSGRTLATDSAARTVAQGQPVAMLSINPSQVSQGQSIFIQTTVNGGTAPYSYSYFDLPSGCSGQSSASFSCTPNSPGNFNVQVTVTDSRGNSSTSPSVSLDVTSSSSGNGNGNGNGNNSNNSLSSLFSGLGGFLSLLLIFGLVGFVSWIVLVVGVWVIAIVLVRRLPKRGEATSTGPIVRCSACSSPIPTSAKFCPECGAPAGPKRT